MYLKSWVEDFVDEDTGEVVSIERNEIILDRDTVLEEEHMEESWILAEDHSFTQRRQSISDYAIIHNTFKKIHQTLKKKP